MDHAAWLDKGMEGADEPAKEAYAYFMRPDPDMRDFLTGIETAEDPLTGKVMRSRVARVGMLRNASDDQKREVRVYLDPLPHIRLDKAKPLQGWYQSKHNLSPTSRPRPCFTEAVLTEPYGGYCTVGCAFCYINSGFRGYRGSGLITVPVDYGAQTRAQIGRMRSSAAGYFSSFTDPFLPLEDYYHNTQQGAQAFTDAGLPVFFLSRLAYPGWAFDELRKSKYSYAQKSINTPDPDDWKKLSPGALPLMDHMDEIRALRRAGIYVSIQVNPIVPGIVNHDDVEQLFEMLAEAGANHVIVKFVEAAHSWAGAMVDRINKRFGDNRGAGFSQLFTQNIGSLKTVEEEYRLEGHARYAKKATSLGLTYATCYEYAYARNDDGTVIDKVGVNIGGRFMTSDQCHGHRVPMFSRLDTGVPFTEVAACPPSGCLTCADTTIDLKPRCGNELFGQAKALRAADYKQPVIGA
jgi:DNA repair photolyase